MKRMLVLIDVDELRMSAGAVGFARDCGLPFDILWAGKDAADAARCEKWGAERVLYAGGTRQTDERTAAMVISLLDRDTCLAGPPTTVDALARVAGVLDLPMLTGVDAVEGDVIQCAAEGGRIRRSVRVDGQAVFSVKSTYPAAAPVDGEAPIVPVKFEGTLPSSPASISQTTTVHKRPPLNEARVIVAGGRSLGESGAFEQYLGKIADKLGGAIAASGGAVHSGIASTDRLIGQTGQTVAPELYIAVGISGADQHVGGMQNSRVIVAVNRDPHASIFRVADYGLVADFRDALPELAEKL